ncbi:MAG: histidine--tRNA ligase [Clostridiaceae bacterium]|nr:histidine--tRNA ligase [Clostridiaceae bacterium]
MKFSAPKGTRDLLPPETAAWQHAEQVFSDVCRRYGYAEIRLPTFEQTELFQRGVGDTTDIVQKEMYTFPDKGGRSMTLRPEGTAGVVRSYVENGMASWPSPVRLYYAITAFRYENVQKGRYREFHQFGCEAIGAAGPAIDAELISLLQLFFAQMGLTETKLRINSIGCPVCREAYQTLLRDWLKPHLPQLCGNCQDRFVRNPLRIIDCKEARCQAVTAQAPAQADHLCPDCQAHFDGLRHQLDVLGLPYVIDRRIVRGLDYYTRTVFEFVSEHVGTQGTICGGGRYDGLIETVGGAPTPGIGFALGVERLLMELDAQGIQTPPAPSPVLFVAIAGDHEDEARRLCFRLRQAGLAVETDLMGRSLKAQMKYAGKSGARFVLVLGDDEADSGIGRLRNLETRAETEVRLDQLEHHLLEA